MKVYLVRKFQDQLPDGEYGVDDNYYLVGIYSTKKKAQYALNNLSEEERTSANPILEIEIDHTYAAACGPWLGGGCYIE